MIYNQIDLNQYSVSSFRTIGTAASPMNLFSIANPAASGKIVVVRTLSVYVDSTAVLLSLAPTLKLSRSVALPTGGTVLTASKIDTTYPTAVAVCRGGTASDGGVATAITATAGTTLVQAFVTRQNTLVGMAPTQEIKLLSDDQIYRDCVVLRENEALLLQVVTVAAATTHFMVNCDWEGVEYIAGNT